MYCLCSVLIFPTVTFDAFQTLAISLSCIFIHYVHKSVCVPQCCPIIYSTNRGTRGSTLSSVFEGGRGGGSGGVGVGCRNIAVVNQAP